MPGTKDRPSPPLRALALAAALLSLPGCGKKGDPLPPLRPTPAAITTLRLAQRGDRLEITFTAPRASTDGARLPVLDIELFVAEKEGELTKVAKVRTFKIAPGEAFRDVIPLLPPATFVRAAARAIARGHRGSLPEPRSLIVVSPLSPPRELRAIVVGDGVRLTWDGEVPAALPTPTPEPPSTPNPTAPPEAERMAPPGALTSTDVRTPPPASPPAVIPSLTPPGAPAPGPASPLAQSSTAAPPTPKPAPAPFEPGFFIYRRSPQGAFAAPLLPSATAERSYVDRSAQPGESWCYEVRAVASADPLVESAPSAEACADVKDVSPPQAPAGLAVLARDEGHELSWSASSEADLAGYRVYRGPFGGPAERIRELPPGETGFLDEDAPRGERVRYTVTAFDRAGNESPRSAGADARRP